VLHYGVDAFARDLAAAGGLGMITPDLIPDEADAWLAASEQHDLEKILTVARRALGADDHRRSYIPGKVATTRWSWSYQHATMNY